MASASDRDDRATGPLRLLILAYYFPPSGGAGVQRVLKWVKYLPRFGVEPVVITPRRGAYPQLDESLLDELPDDVEVARVLSLDPFGTYARLTGKTRDDAVSGRTDTLGTDPSLGERLARWLRGTFFIPDARVGWAPFATAKGLQLQRRGPFDALITTGPPHSTHLAGATLRRQIPIWVADFRDPWTDIHYYESLGRRGLPRRIDEALEKAVLQSADIITTVSPSWAKMLEEKGGRPVELIRNGFDPQDFAAPALPPPDDRFVVAHVGSLFAGRYPAALIDALERLQAGGQLRGAELRVVGRVDDETRARLAKVAIPLTITGYLPHREAVAEMHAAHVLLLTTELHPAEAGHIPGKLYEYLASGRPVLGLGDPMGDAAALLRETSAGQMLARDDGQGVESFLKRHHTEWLRGDVTPGAEPESLKRYSRAHQAARLADLLRASLSAAGP